MTKKWLWYVCIGLICCSSIAYVYAKQTTGVSKARTERAELIAQLEAAEIEIKMTGGTPELELLAAKLRAKLYPETRQTISDAMVQRLAEGAMQAEVLAAQEEKQKAEEIKKAKLLSLQESDASLAEAENDQDKLLHLQQDSRANYMLQLEQRQANGGTLSESEIADLDAYYNELNAEQGRSGNNPLDAVGGPDNYGYRWVNDLDGDTAVYNWVDIAGAGGGTLLTTLDRTSSANAAITPSFAFPFYGVNRSTLYVGSNGYISMTATSSSSNTCTLPTSTFASGAIFVFWDALHTSMGGTGTFNTVSDSGSVWWKDNGDHIIVQWDSVGRATPTFQHTNSFQALLYSNGKIKMQWKEITRYAPSTTYPSATVAIQSGTGGQALTYKCNAAADSTFETRLPGHAAWFYLDLANAPVGRCCYNNNTSCADNNLATCNSLTGTWTAGLNCTANPCPYALDGGETCAAAVALPLGHTVIDTTTGHIDDDPGVQCFRGSTDPYEGSNTAGDVWYSCVGNGTQYKVSLCNPQTNYDTQIAVYCGDCTNPRCVAGNDDASTGSGPLNCSLSGTRSVATWCAEAGRTYYIVVDGWSTGVGAFAVTLTSNGGACDSTLINCNPTGRCCYINGGVPTCADITSADCATLGGLWDATATCASSPCPTGRCCYVSGGAGACANNWQVQCNALAGTWTAGTTCEATPCPTGRCCYNGGANCQTVIAEVCTQLAGTWTAGLTCEANPCPVTLAGGETCADAVLINVGGSYNSTTAGHVLDTGQPTCETYAGNTAPAVWYKVVGNGDSLSASLCDAITTYDSQIGIYCGDCGALTCVGYDDDACDTPGLASVQNWASVNGTTYYIMVTGYTTNSGPYALSILDLGAYTGTPVNCAPTGRCCYLQGGAPQCADLFAADCAALGGQFNATTTCAASPCPTGRCCYLDVNHAAQCATNTQLECTALAGTWLTGSSCATPCPTARCCYNDGASCENTTIERCTFLTGTYTSGSTCEANPCPIPPVNDHCTGAILIDPDAYCSASVEVNTTTADATIGDTCDFDSNGPDVFYKLILADCRRIAISCGLATGGTTYDTHISIYPEGVCAVVPALCCNDDHANFGTNGCALPAWDVAAQHPTSYFGWSYMALEIGPGTYYIRAGRFSTGTGIYNLTVYDNGPCVQTAGCQPGDVVTNVTVHRDALAVPPGSETFVTLRWTNTNAGNYKVWSSTNLANDGDPDGPDADLKAGDDPMWVLETLTPLALPAGPVSWNRAPGFENYINFVVTPDCDPTPTMGQCCYVSAGNYACAYITQAACNTLNGNWTAYLTCDCPSTACPQEGRCCYLDVNNHGACDDLLEVDCLALNGTWTAGVSCASAPCDLGRCCYSGGCVNVQEDECTFLAGTWNTDLDCSTACPVPPSNDLCANAITVSIPSTTNGSTFLATAEAEVIPTCGSGYNSTSTGVWYTVVGNGDSLRVSMCATSPVWDSEIFVFCGSCASFTCIGGDDDACGGGTIFAVNSQLDWASVNGVTYYVLVAGWLSGDEGDFTLDVSDLGAYTVTPITCP